MNDKKFYLPMLDDDYVNYKPSAKLINAYINTIELSEYIKRKQKTDIISFEDGEDYVIDEFFSNKLSKVLEVYDQYQNLFSNPEFDSQNINDYFGNYFTAIEKFIDLVIFINDTTYHDSKMEFVRYNESKKALLFDHYVIEFESTAINLDYDSLLDALDNKPNLKLVKIRNKTTELFNFIQGYEPEFNDMESVILFKNIMRATCIEIACKLEEIFMSALDFAIIGLDIDEIFKTLFINKGELYIYDEESAMQRQNNINTPVRRPFWRFRSKNSV